MKVGTIFAAGFSALSLVSAEEAGKHKSKTTSTSTTTPCRHKTCYETTAAPRKTTRAHNQQFEGGEWPVETRTVHDREGRRKTSCTYTVTGWIDHTVTHFVTATPTAQPKVTAIQHVQVSQDPVTVFETITSGSQTTVHPIVEVTIPAPAQDLKTIFTTVWQTVTESGKEGFEATETATEWIHPSKTGHHRSHIKSESAEPTAATREHTESTDVAKEITQTVTKDASITVVAKPSKTGSGVPYTFTEKDGSEQTIFEEHAAETEGLEKRQIPLDPPVTKISGLANATTVANGIVSTITRTVPAAATSDSVVSVVGGVTSGVSVVEELTTVVPVAAVSSLTNLRPISNIIEEVTTLSAPTEALTVVPTVITRLQALPTASIGTSKLDALISSGLEILISKASEIVVVEPTGGAEATLTVTDLLPAQTTTVRTVVPSLNSTSARMITSSMELIEETSSITIPISSKANATSAAAPAATSGAARIDGPCANLTRFHTDASGVKYEVHDKADSSVGSYSSLFTTNVAGCFKACDDAKECNGLTFVPISDANNGGNCYLRDHAGEYTSDARTVLMCSANRVDARTNSTTASASASVTTASTSAPSNNHTKSEAAEPTFGVRNSTSSLALSINSPSATGAANKTSASQDPAAAAITTSSSALSSTVDAKPSFLNRTITVDHTLDPATLTVEHTATPQVQSKTVTIVQSGTPVTLTVDHTKILTNVVEHTSSADHTHTITVTDICKTCAGGSTTFTSTSISPAKTPESYPAPEPTYESKHEGYSVLTTYPATYATQTSYSTSSADVKPVYNTYTIPESTAWVYPTQNGHAKRGGYEPPKVGYETPKVSTSTIWATSCTTHSSTTETDIYPYTTTTYHAPPPQTYAPSSSTHQTYAPHPTTYPVSSSTSTHPAYAPPPSTYAHSSSTSSHQTYVQPPPTYGHSSSTSTHQTYAPPSYAHSSSSSTHASYIPPPSYAHSSSSTTHASYIPPPPTYVHSSSTHHTYVPPTYPVSTPSTHQTYAPPPKTYVPPPPAKNTTTPCPSTLKTTTYPLPPKNTTVPAPPPVLPPIVTHPYMNTSTTSVHITTSVTQETTVYKTRPTKPAVSIPPKEPLPPPSYPKQPEQPQSPSKPIEPETPKQPQQPETPKSPVQPQQPNKPETPKSPVQPPAQPPVKSASTTAPAPSGPSVQMSNDGESNLPASTFALVLMIAAAIWLS